jgi:hypothetical protein
MLLEYARQPQNAAGRPPTLCYVRDKVAVEPAARWLDELSARPVKPGRADS